MLDVEIVVAQGSLTDGSEDVLVNASNTHFRLGSGVSAAIGRACGPGIQRAIDESRDAIFGSTSEPGNVMITNAGSHPTARWIAHVAVLDYRPGNDAQALPDGARIQVACSRLWQAIESIGVDGLSVAMVALGAGTGQLTIETSVGASCTALRNHLTNATKTRIRRVCFYGWSEDDFRRTIKTVLMHFPLGVSLRSL